MSRNETENNGCARLALVDRRFDDRIRSWREAYQFDARIQKEAKEHPKAVYTLTLYDFEQPWNQSAAKIACMSVEEICNISLDEVKDLTPEQIKMVILKVKDDKKYRYISNAETLGSFLGTHVCGEIGYLAILRNRPYLADLMTD